MSKTYAALCLLLILALLTGCGTRIIPAVPTITPSAPPEEAVPPPPTPTPLLSPPPEAVNPSPQVSPSPAPRTTAQLPVQRHFPPQLLDAPAEEPPAAETVALPESYTVNKGDCLWTIAEELYGSGADWRRLWAANRETVEDPGLVWIGQVLKLPEETG